MMEAAIASIFACLALIFFAWRARRRTHLLQKYEQCMEAFIEDAHTLTAADSATMPVLDMLEFMSRKAADRTAARHFLVMLLRRRARAGGPAMPEEFRQFARENPELWHVLGRAAASSMLAMSFIGGPAGTLLRRLVLFDAKQHEDRTRDLAAGFREAECHSAQAA